MISKEDLIRLYFSEQKSYSEIAKIYNVAFQTVGKWIKKYGLKPREWTTKGLGYKFIGHKLSEETKTKISKSHTGKKLTPEHIKKIINNIKPKHGSEHPSWKGGRWINKSGYIIIYNPESKRGYSLEHRFIMEKHLGRKLNNTEHIHHIDGNKQNNNIDNLKLVSNYEHAQIHWTDPQHVKEQSERIKEIRKNKFWSTKR